MTRARRIFPWFLAAASAAALFGLAYLLHRPVFEHYAAEALCYADGDGFAAAVLSISRPGGFLGWCAAFLAAAGSSPLWAWLPWFLLPVVSAFVVLWAFPALRRPVLAPLAAVPALGAALLAVTVDAQIWAVPDAAFIVEFLLGLTCAIAAAGVVLRLMRRFGPAGWPVWILIPVLAAAFVPFGVFAFVAAGLVAVLSFAAPGPRLTRGRLIFPVLLLAAVFVAPLALRGPWFNDLAPVALYSGWPLFLFGAGGGFLNAVSTVVLAQLALLAGAAAACGFVVPDLPLRRRGLYAALVTACLAASFAGALPFRMLDVCPVLAMERCLDRFDYRGVLAVDTANPMPQRMAVAYRIVAQFAAGRIGEDLFKFPILTNHETNQAQEMRMDGYRLLFHYGFPLPARRWLFEQVQASGWTPPRFRTAGDCALAAGEPALAARGYGQLARCAFHGAEAARRLSFLTNSVATGADVEALRRIAALHGEACDANRDMTFFELTDSAETFIYNAYSVRKRLTPRTFPMYVAAMLLRRDLSLFSNDLRVLQANAPAGPAWPLSWQEGYMTWIASLPQESRPAPLPGVLDPRALARFNAFSARGNAAGRCPSDADRAALRRDYATSFYFYNAFVR